MMVTVEQVLLFDAAKEGAVTRKERRKSGSSVRERSFLDFIAVVMGIMVFMTNCL